MARIDMARITVMGAGVGGMPTATANGNGLKRRLGKQHAVVLIGAVQDASCCSASARSSFRWALLRGMAGVLLALAAPAAFGDGHLERSRAIADDFQQQLGGQLVSAVAERGPVAAIEVCSEVAPAIAAQASAEAGASVGRTALRVRNPDNAPDADAEQVL